MFGNKRSGTYVRWARGEQMFDRLGNERVFGPARERLYHIGSLPVKGRN